MKGERILSCVLIIAFVVTAIVAISGAETPQSHEKEMGMITVGDKVQVTDQVPHVEGEVVEISTWKQVNGGPSTKRCYRVRCDGWIPPERWIGAGHVETIGETGGIE